MVDACRNNPLKDKGRSVGNNRGLSAIEPPKGQMVVYSASKGQQALDRLTDNDNNPNGVFTREFIKRMKQPGVRIEDLMREVQDSVEALAQSISHEQRPAVYNESRGNFYFFGPTRVRVQGQAASAAADPETRTWDVAERANSVPAYQAYLDAYPKGRYVVAAKIAKDALGQMQQEVSRLLPPVVVPNSGLIAERYRDNNDGTVTDVVTNLQWMRCSVGQRWDGNSCAGNATNAAMAQVQQQLIKTFASYSDWRMPTIDELKTLIYCSGGQPKPWNDSGNACGITSQTPTISTDAFPNTPGQFYWSTSAYTVFSSDKWLANFDNGGADGYSPSSNASLRAVRGMK
jgi:hypothetical protein